MQKKWLFMALAFPGLSMAAEGMWTMDNLPTSKLQAEYGFKPSAEWVKNTMLGSVKLPGCSGSFVSKDGLVMTNHHCASGCIEQLSSAKQNYIENGFLAKKREEEQACPAMELNRLEEITDVTAEVKKATAGLDGAAYKQAQNVINNKLTAACVGDDKEKIRCDIVDLYHGGRYHLYKYHRYADTRLVWAPEKAIAFFGGDPDNFNFPRYDLDITMLRVYENGKPAEIKNFFPFSKNGPQEGEMTFITGHPGSTQRQLTIAQLSSLRDIGLIDNLQHMAELRGVLTQYRKSSPEAARTADQMLFGIENSYKSGVGRLQTLLDPEFIARKQAEETALRQFVDSKPELKEKISGAWDAIAKAQESYRQLHRISSMTEGAAAFNSNYFRLARILVRAADEKGKNSADRLPEFAETRLPAVQQSLFSKAPIYPEFEKVKLTHSLTKMREDLGANHAFVKQVLGKLSPEQLTENLVSKTRLADIEYRKTLWNGGKEAIAQSDDPFIKLALAVDAESRSIRKRLEQEVQSVVQKNSELIAQARFAQSGTSVYPDATGTLRLSYGEVKGWELGENKVKPFTNFAGAFEHDTGAFPFALPASWHAAKGKLNLQQPYNFVTNNDIIGGNSGSPLINKNGEIVGLVFDGNIHSLGGAFWFDSRSNRAVAVHSGGILEAMDKIYGAKELLKELTSK
ncbi:S46 family peptidase [Undibacterium sp. TS12]|uniref:S46 family peptidase n=1 Tax=Undibacterium sp. TS12 TaxID=2908202 RepID=UPI001F4C7A51|nr:S46 family peptidase [Undibacterium sp. TS12]MCH8621627.1 S46 family peptidase [Undibacterium sp. TS12]